jgi:hypothetical protein
MDSNPNQAMKTKKNNHYRVTQWVDMGTMSVIYGIQHKRDKWVNCSVDGVALLYTKQATADKHCRWLNNPKGTEPEWSKDSYHRET